MKLISPNNHNHSSHNQQGIASIMVVFVLVVILSIICISFAKIMERTQQSTTADQQAKAADYAAQSGVNDVISYLKYFPQTSVTECNELLDTPEFQGFIVSSTIGSQTKYTCILVDPNPSDLKYQNLNPYEARLSKLRAISGTPTKLMFSWQSTNRAHNQAAPSGLNMLDEKAWSDGNFAPALKLTLYPLPNPANGDISSANTNKKQYFLYPRAGSSITTLPINSTGLRPVNCYSGTGKTSASFIGSSDYDCTVVFDLAGAPAGTVYYYASITPYYDQASLTVKVNNASGAAKFSDGQSVVDVTAKSGPAVKRLQARVQLGSAFGGLSIPDFALRTAGATCKRYIVPTLPTQPVTVEPGDEAFCIINNLPPP